MREARWRPWVSCVCKKTKLRRLQLLNINDSAGKIKAQKESACLKAGALREDKLR